MSIYFFNSHFTKMLVVELTHFLGTESYFIKKLWAIS